MNGKGIVMDQRSAAEYYKKAADQGHANAITAHK
jgi:TPR repeat protein